MHFTGTTLKSSYDERPSTFLLVLTSGSTRLDIPQELNLSLSMGCITNPN